MTEELCRVCAGQTRVLGLSDDAFESLTGVQPAHDTASLVRCPTCRTMKTRCTLPGEIHKIVIEGNVEM